MDTLLMCLAFPASGLRNVAPKQCGWRGEKPVGYRGGRPVGSCWAAPPSALHQPCHWTRERKNCACSRVSCPDLHMHLMSKGKVPFLPRWRGAAGRRHGSPGTALGLGIIVWNPPRIPGSVSLECRISRDRGHCPFSLAFCHFKEQEPEHLR